MHEGRRVPVERHHIGAQAHGVLDVQGETLTAKTIQSRPVEAVGSEQDAVRTCLSAQFGNFRLSVKAVSCASCWRAER